MTPPPAEQFAARIFMGPALRAQPDRRLVDLVRDGYDAAFEEIVRRYRRPLDRFAAAIVGGHSEDVTQDAFSKALPALRGSEAEVELRPWLYRIVRNTALNDLRDRAPATDELLEDGLPGGRSAAAEVVAREELADLMQRLRALPEPQRAAIVMRELEGLSHEEIAAALGVTGGAARQVIFRARAALRDGLGLLIPVPLVRALAESGGEAGRAGGAIAAGASASSAGGAALGGLGGGALKAGMATILIAGAVGAGVAVEYHKGAHPGPEAAEAAPLVRHQGSSGARAGEAASGTTGGGPGKGGSGSHGGEKGASGPGGSGSPGGSLSGSHGGSSGGSGQSGSSGGPTQSPSSGPGPGGGDHHGGSSGSGGSGSGQSGSDGGSGDSSGGSIGSGDGGSTGGSGSDDGGSSGSGSGSGDGGSDGGTITEPAPTPELDQSDDGGSDSGSESPDSSGSGDSGGELSGSGSGSLDGSSTAP
ncbi:MAG TPA: sigma-70 family RNA polymerase sigma factor [Solirubrobacterales bacterium]|nr:sigma-70 family RNA polymerase sigma factor [Solirubrobacterales bacterium]